MLTAFEWREELRARHAEALRIAYDNVNAYGWHDIRTQRAFRTADHLGAVKFDHNA